MRLTFWQIYINRIWQNNLRFSNLQHSTCVMPFVCWFVCLLQLHIAFNTCYCCFLVLFYCVRAGNTRTHKHTNTRHDLDCLFCLLIGATALHCFFVVCWFACRCYSARLVVCYLFVCSIAHCF